MERAQRAQATVNSLNRNLTQLADNPDNVRALIAASAAALELEDAETALGFFVRANELSPRNGRIAAGLGGALVRLERPLEAMQQFREAERLGAPLIEYAADRGFAGQPALAQTDYRLVLDRRASDEIQKRLAISLAISGARAAALEVLDPMLRAQDITAWRTRAFVIGLTGDVREMVEAAAITLPWRELEILTPYLGRLSSLSDAGKAQAVHFGNFATSGDGSRYALSDFPDLAVAGTAGAGLVPKGEALGQRSETQIRRERREAIARRVAARDSRSRHRPGWSETVLMTQANVPPPSPPQPVAEPEAAEQVVPARNWVQLATGPTQDGLRFTYRRYARANAIFTDREGWYTPLGQINRLLLGPFDSGAEAQRFINALAEVGIQVLRWRSPDGQAIVRLYGEGGSSQPTEAAPSLLARHWAQVAIGQQQSALCFAYRQFSRRAPDAFEGQTDWFTPLKAIYRLLAGPFDSRVGAQTFLNAIAEEGNIEGRIYRSSEGQEVTPLNSR